MRCYYGILGVRPTATKEEIKKAYEKLALKWRPDRDFDTPEVIDVEFQLIQQAWEVLSTERAWYDKNRQAFLNMGTSVNSNGDEERINILQFISPKCFKDYGDDHAGFYNVYRTAFEKIAAEDKFSEEEVPSFGNSQSSYEDVQKFYAFWSNYNTRKSFAWLTPYDVCSMPNRKMVRFAKKENKRVRDRAKRDRNEKIRNLVEFVKKKDKRVEKFAEVLAERAKENARKTQRHKKKQRLRQRSLKDGVVSEWSNYSNIESELEVIEADLAEEFGETLSSDADSDDLYYMSYVYCAICGKLFKSCNTFEDHESSRKHKKNIALLKAAADADED